MFDRSHMCDTVQMCDMTHMRDMTRMCDISHMCDTPRAFQRCTVWRFERGNLPLGIRVTRRICTT